MSKSIRSVQMKIPGWVIFFLETFFSFTKFYSAIIVWQYIFALLCTVEIIITTGLFHKISSYEIHFDQKPICAKGQLLSKCPFVFFKSPKNPSKKFPGFLPYPLKRGKIKKIRALYITNCRILFWLHSLLFWSSEWIFNVQHFLMHYFLYFQTFFCFKSYGEVQIKCNEVNL